MHQQFYIKRNFFLLFLTVNHHLIPQKKQNKKKEEDRENERVRAKERQSDRFAHQT